MKDAADAFIGAQPIDVKEEEKKNDKNPVVILPTDELGYPILPSWEEIKDAVPPYKKAIIASYMREMYRK
jgi:hypothetical protein